MARQGKEVWAGRLRVALSGRTAISRDGKEYVLGGRHPCVLFAILAGERHRAVSRDELADALWGEEPPDSWQSSLRVTLSKVRAFLLTAGFDSEALRSGAGGYQLRLGEKVEVDTEAAAHEVDLAERALAAKDPESATRFARGARAVLSSPFVPGGEGPWLDTRREEIRSLLVPALDAEAEARTATGEAATAIAAATEAVKLEPYHESAYRALMRAHTAAGNKAEALAWYERCRRLLAEELAVDPAPATQALHVQILRDELGPRTRPALPRVSLKDAELAPAARQALAQRRWPEAFALLSRADATGVLTPGDLEALGDAAVFSGHHPESIAARKRAHAAYVEAGDKKAAARAALALASNYGIRGQLAAAQGWFGTAARLLEHEPPAPEHGFLSFVATIVLLDKGDLNGCLENAQRTFEAGERFAIPDLQALGITFRGLVLARQETPEEAIPLLDEGMAMATSGRLTPRTTGLIYCRTIRTWLDLFEYRRAAEWIETIAQCSVETGFAGNPGDCNAHLAAALEARGTWAEAQREAELACELCGGYELSHVGLASYTLGEIYLCRGELDKAADAFQRAHEHGLVPQPGAALLQLAKGDVAGALASLRPCLDGDSGRLSRARMLPAAVEIGLAAGELESAQAEADELAEIAEAYGSAVLRAVARRAVSAVRLSRGEAATAVRGLREAVDLYRQAEIPYELARARLLLAEALLAEGDRAGAVMELQAAGALFRRLGAAPDARACDRRLERLRAT
jgi:DNA-binding SARP family transcriptional activator